MRMISSVFAAFTMSAGLLAGGQALAQAEVAPPITLPGAVTTGDVVAACTSIGATDAACQGAVHAHFAYMASIGVTGAELEADIAQLVAALAQADVPSALTPIIVAALNTIALTYATGAQAAAILDIAATLEAGGDIETGALVESPA